MNIIYNLTILNIYVKIISNELKKLLKKIYKILNIYIIQLITLLIL
jgi:hypothetical protein